MKLSELSIADLYAAVSRVKERMEKIEPKKMMNLDEWNWLAQKKNWINVELDKRIEQLDTCSDRLVRIGSRLVLESTLKRESSIEKAVKDIFPSLP